MLKLEIYYPGMLKSGCLYVKMVYHHVVDPDDNVDWILSSHLYAPTYVS